MGYSPLPLIVVLGASLLFSDSAMAGVDPVKPNPNTGANFNRYSYANNNPYRFTDPDGRWPTKIHGRIIDMAFPGLSSSQRQVLKDSSKRMDSVLRGGQSTGSSYQHAMRGPRQSPADAKQASDNFVAGQEGAARVMQGEMPTSIAGIGRDSLAAAGNAMHTVTDGASPAHTNTDGDPMKWSGIRSISALMEAKEHASQESTITATQMSAAVDSARQVFENVYGQDLLNQATKEPE